MIDSQRRSPDDKSQYSALRPLALSQVFCSQDQKQPFDLSLILVLCIPCLSEQSEEIFACLLVWLKHAGYFVRDYVCSAPHATALLLHNPGYIFHPMYPRYYLP